MRKNNRKFDQARNLSIVPNFQKNAIGSVLIKFEDNFNIDLPGML